MARYSSYPHEFDISVAGAHTIPTKSKQLTGLKINILHVTNAHPRSSPQVTFSVTDGQEIPVDPSKLARLSFNLSALTPTPPWRPRSWGCAGCCIRIERIHDTFKRTLPNDAKGTWAVGAEAYWTVPIASYLVIWARLH